MSSVHTSPTISKRPLSLNHRDETQLVQWLATLTEQFEDLAAAANDATRRKRRRALSRAAARNKVQDASAAIDSLLGVLHAALHVPQRDH